MLGLHWGELLILLFVLLLFFGASRLPQLGTGLGAMANGFRQALARGPAGGGADRAGR